MARPGEDIESDPAGQEHPEVLVGWGQGRLTCADTVLSGATENEATDQLGQHPAQQRIQQEDCVAFGQALADAACHQGYHVAHLGHGQGKYTLEKPREAGGSSGPAPGTPRLSTRGQTE